METTMSDVASIMNANKDGFLEGNGIVILILFLLFLSGGGSLFGGNNAMGNYATQSDIQRTADFSNISNKLDGITNGLSSVGYENAQLHNNTNMQMMNGFNSITNSLNIGFDSVNANINQLGNQMQSCCCEIKTQLLQDKYDSAQNQLTQAQNIIANATQTQNILNSLGRFYAYPPLATTTTTTTT